MYSSTFPCHPHQPSHCLPDLHVSLHSFVKAKCRCYLLHETCPELSLSAHLYQILLFKNIMILITIHLLFECKSNQLICLKASWERKTVLFYPLSTWLKGVMSIKLWWKKEWMSGNWSTLPPVYWCTTGLNFNWLNQLGLEEEASWEWESLLSLCACMSHEMAWCLKLPSKSNKLLLPPIAQPRSSILGRLQNFSVNTRTPCMQDLSSNS